ncbi:MAG: hypothetical protein KBD56_06600 [Candidatus Eisenbacteria bacterium]|nr:hypothetical protein [Candidatus Eisenbacteria bacterium]
MPRGEAIPGWRLQEEPEVFPADEMWRQIDGAAEQYIDYGCLALAVGYYGLSTSESSAGAGEPAESHASASDAADAASPESAESPEIVVEVYETSEPRGSFGLYALERPADAKVLSIGAQGVQTGGEVLLFGDRFYIKLRAYPENDDNAAAMLLLAHAIADRPLSGSAFPAELARFPHEPVAPKEYGFVPKSILGLSAMPAAFLAQYSGEGGALTLYLARLADPASAADMFAKARREIENRSVRAPEELAIDNAQGIRADLKYQGPLLLLLQQSEIVLASGAIDEEWARGIMRALIAKAND